MKKVNLTKMPDETIQLAKKIVTEYIQDPERERVRYNSSIILELMFAFYQTGQIEWYKKLLWKLKRIQDPNIDRTLEDYIGEIEEKIKALEDDGTSKVDVGGLQ